MPKNKDAKKRIMRRLLPLYIAAACQAFVLWYAIEKIFMRQIGFDDAGIGALVALYSASMLLLETPSGILADRWSRKGVLVFASIALAASSLTGGLSTEPGLYVVSTLLWGVFYAMYSGTYDSIMYDVILEETGKSDLYEHFYGYFRIIDSAALVAAALGGSVIASTIGLRSAYFWSAGIALLPLILLWFFKEPQLHKVDQHGSVREHVAGTFKAVLCNPSLILLVITTVCVGVLLGMIYDFSQLWFIALGLPTVLFGVAYAAVLASTGVGGMLARFAGKHRLLMADSMFIVLVLCAVLLALVQNSIVVIIAQVAFGSACVMLGVIFSHQLHDQLPSRVRAGASSAVNSIVRIALVPIALIFGALSAHSVFTAAWVMVAVSVIALVSYISLRKQVVA